MLYQIKVTCGACVRQIMEISFNTYYAPENLGEHIHATVKAHRERGECPAYPKYQSNARLAHDAISDG